MGMEKKGRLIALDGLKGLCCIPIVFAHYVTNAVNKFGATTDQLPFYKYLRLLYDQGATFIFPFFWLSGFLMAMQYKDSLKQMSLGVFLKRRMRKLYPMIFASITLGVILSVLDRFLTGSAVTTPFDLWLLIKDYSLTYSGWAEKVELIGYVGGVEWFICVLLLCYIYYFLIIHKIKRENYILSLFVLFFAGWAVYAWPIGPIPFFGGKGGYCAFFGGTLLYEFMYGDLKYVFRTNLSNNKKTTISIIAVVALGIFAVLGYLSTMIFLIVVCPILILLALESGWVKAILEIRPVQMLGTLSMSVYLSHALVLRAFVIAIKRLGIGRTFCDIPVFFTVIAGCFLVAVIYYLLIEKKFVPFFNNRIGKIFPYFAD